MNSLTIFHNWLFACPMRPSMLLLVSSRMATCTRGFLVLNRGSSFAPAVATSEHATAIVNNFHKLAFIIYLSLSLVAPSHASLDGVFAGMLQEFCIFASSRWTVC